jgi:hypothetical protein
MLDMGEQDQGIGLTLTGTQIKANWNVAATCCSRYE